jgi:hypothetical protein
VSSNVDTPEENDQSHAAPLLQHRSIEEKRKRSGLTIDNVAQRLATPAAKRAFIWAVKREFPSLRPGGH